MPDVALHTPATRSHFLSRSFSDLSLNTFKNTWKLDDSKPSPASSRSPSPSGKGEGSASSKDSDSSSRSTNSGSSIDAKDASQAITAATATLKTPADTLTIPKARPRPTTQGGEKKAKRPYSMSFMRSPASDPQVATLKSFSPRTSLTSITPSPLSNGRRSPKDDLWYGFRSLESDYTKFSNKSCLEKSNTIRMYLLPFIRKFQGQTSAVDVSMEELDRRIRVLNRWWTGLLANLRNYNAEAVAGNDRPLYYEAIIGLMTRPEWRNPPSTLAPYSQQNPTTSTSFSSLASASSHYSMEKSVQHNMRSLFTGAIGDTLAFVLDKMNVRQAASMVHFAGKVIAFAFFFCNQVAETLVGLWDFQASHLRRVLSEYGVGRGTDLHAVAEDVITEFPVCLQSLGFIALGPAIQRMKRPTKPPIGMDIDWAGAWVVRWRGRDSDLLFAFSKSYLILLNEYLPDATSPATRLCAPGFVMVQAQLLAQMDSMIHRPTYTPYAPQPPSAVTFDEVLADAQSSASPVQSLKNVTKPMVDQRFFTLVKEISSDKAVTDSTRYIFAETFGALLRAAVRKTQVVDHSACIAVCDILEEAIPLLHGLEMTFVPAAKYVDWPFWIDVCKQMLQNENSMSELRLFSLVYMLWDLIVQDADRKRSVCLDWLLEEKVWQRFFYHWCPMTRAYFMRLICWRVGRVGETFSSLDTEILQVLSERLRTAFANHTWMKTQSDKKLIPRPLMHPCPPAPSRKLAIVKVDCTYLGKMFSFEGPIPPAARPAPSPPREGLQPAAPATLPAVTENEKLAKDSDNASIASLESVSSMGSVIKKRWGIFKSLGLLAGNTEPQASSTPAKAMPKMLQHGKRQPFVASNQGGKRIQFKFNLEVTERSTNPRPRPVSMPRLSAHAQEHMELHGEELVTPVNSLQPTKTPPLYWKYASRALAEWTLIIDECDNFMEKRKMDPGSLTREVEIPMLSIESLRRPGQ